MNLISVYLQDIGFEIELAGVEGCVNCQMDRVLGFASVVVVDQSRVRRDLVAGGKPTNKRFLLEGRRPHLIQLLFSITTIKCP